jgi:hypothetical protein
MLDEFLLDCRSSCGAMPVGYCALRGLILLGRSKTLRQNLYILWHIDSRYRIRANIRSNAMVQALLEFFGN